MKIWNLSVGTAEDGSKILDVQIHGVIDGGWLDDASTSTAEIAKALAEHQDAKKINVHINSVGGSLFGGVALYNILQAHGAEVTSYVDGLAASAASLIAMAGKTVIGRGAMLMIHNPLAIAMGDAADLRRTAAVLDKARDSLLSIYKAKTGKDATELKAMLDAETWMTAEQALRQGFANEIADGGEEVPTVEDKGDVVLFNSAAFPRTSLPAQILAMAAPRPPANGTPAGGGKPEKMTITREVLSAEAPDLLAALLEEGRKAGKEEGEKAGITAERARLQAIDELELKGCADLVAAAKYGAEPKTAEQLAVAALKASKQAGLDLLAARERESKGAANVHQSAPEHVDAAAKKANDDRLVRAIVGNNNHPSGGVR